MFAIACLIWAIATAPSLPLLGAVVLGILFRLLNLSSFSNRQQVGVQEPRGKGKEEKRERGTTQGSEGKEIPCSLLPSPPAPQPLVQSKRTAKVVPPKETFSSVPSQETSHHEKHPHPLTLISPETKASKTAKLQSLLEIGDWEKADEETLKIMLKIAGRKKKGWLDLDSIQNFPREDLRVIDRLWLEASHGRFGFSVQKRIWKKLGGDSDVGDRFRELFAKRIGWRVDEEWLEIEELDFSLSAPSGHLPATAVRLGGLSWGVDGFWWQKREAVEFLLSQKDW